MPKDNYKIQILKKIAIILSASIFIFVMPITMIKKAHAAGLAFGGLKAGTISGRWSEQCPRPA